MHLREEVSESGAWNAANETIYIGNAEKQGANLHLIAIPCLAASLYIKTL